MKRTNIKINYFHLILTFIFSLIYCVFGFLFLNEYIEIEANIFHCLIIVAGFFFYYMIYITNISLFKLLYTFFLLFTFYIFVSQYYFENIKLIKIQNILNSSKTLILICLFNLGINIWLILKKNNIFLTFGLLGVIVGLINYYKYGEYSLVNIILIDIFFFIFFIISLYLINILDRFENKQLKSIIKYKYRKDVLFVIIIFVIIIIIPFYVVYPKKIKIYGEKGLTFLNIDKEKKRVKPFLENYPLYNQNSLNHKKIDPLDEKRIIFSVKLLDYQTNNTYNKYDKNNIKLYLREYVYGDYNSQKGIFLRSSYGENAQYRLKSNNFIKQSKLSKNAEELSHRIKLEYHIGNIRISSLPILYYPVNIRLISNKYIDKLYLNRNMTLFLNKTKDNNSIKYIISSNIIYADNIKKSINKPQFNNIFFNENNVESIYYRKYDSNKFIEKLKILAKNIIGKELFNKDNKDIKDILVIIDRTISYLRQNYTYSLDPEISNDCNNIVDCFLFRNEKKGYCVHFSEAFAIIMRLCDVPARVVGGYIATEKSFNKKTHTYNIVEKNSHAWVECLLPEFGWISFDPSPNTSENDRMNKKYSVHIDYEDNNDQDSENNNIVRKEIWDENNEIIKTEFYFSSNNDNFKQKLIIEFDENHSIGSIKYLNTNKSKKYYVEKK